MVQPGIADLKPGIEIVPQIFNNIYVSVEIVQSLSVILMAILLWQF